jgi:hypothetical protein
MLEFDKDRACVKCGEADSTLRYCDYKSAGLLELCSKKEVHKEHFHKVCRTCGYEWLEATLK